MEKKIIINAVNKYLDYYKDEQERLNKFIEYLDKFSDEEIVDWNNFVGHIAAGGFIYSLELKKFLVLYHKDLKIYLYPGGHVDKEDINPLVTARREVLEETGIENLKLLNIDIDEIVPIDIDTHMIPYNERLDLPAHYHFEFRYLFVVDKVYDVKVDTSELGDYRWIDMNELYDNPYYGRISSKLDKILKGRYDE